VEIARRKKTVSRDSTRDDSRGCKFVTDMRFALTRALNVAMGVFGTWNSHHARDEADAVVKDIVVNIVERSSADSRYLSRASP